jgi:uncharacterized protein YjbI with pentapeptide repeats
MRLILSAFLLLAAAAAFTTPARARELWECPPPEAATTTDQDQYSCPCAKDWKPTDDQLKIILARHKDLLAEVSHLPSDSELEDSRRANLCNADLKGGRLAKAAEQTGRSRVNLRFANLNGANLREAKLNGAMLEGARLNGSNLWGAELNRTFLGLAELNGADLRRAKLNRTLMARAELNGADLSDAELNRADLHLSKFNCLNPGTLEQRCAEFIDAELNEANLPRAELNGARLLRVRLNGARLLGAKFNCLNPGTPEPHCADLSDAELDGADLTRAELNGADLSGAKLNCLNPGTPEQRCADLSGAELNGADLEEAELNGADLTGSDLRDTNLLKTELAGAKLDGVRISGARYEPVSAPDSDYLTNIQGISIVWFESGNSLALVKLRAAFKEVGQRNAEREATFVLKHAERLEVEKKGGLGSVESGFNFVLFEFTTEWGMRPGRALIILAGIALFTSLYYARAAHAPMDEEGGIYRLWEDDECKKKDWVEETGIPVILWGLYFSLLSAFHIGFRELNIGNWIQRINPHDYSVRATGWVKTLSGVQSVLSVYLLAIWALTYFGRPFD